MTERQRSAVGLAGWLLVLAVALAGLHALGSGPLATPPVHGFARWLEARDAATAAFAVVRLVALALGWYLLAATVLALGLRLTDRSASGTAAAAVEATTPAFVRRLVRGAAGLTLAAGAATIAGPALAGATTAPDRGAAVTMRRLDDDPVVMRRLADDPTEPPVTMRRLPDDGAGAEGPPASTTPRTWTVQPGQHLWLVAEEVLRTAWQQPPTDRQTDPYWRTLVAANRDVLADPGNADLLFPGQVLEVPDPPPKPPASDV